MTLNKTKIEWCDRTWNPVTGCLHGCSYCYARKIAERFRGTKAWPNGFEPTFHPERLYDPFNEKEPQVIFVCSMADLFGLWVEAYWIWRVFEAMDKAPWHTYCFLTKNPVRMKSFSPVYNDEIRPPQDNWWYGTSVTNQLQTWQINELRGIRGNRFVSFEPLLEVIPNINLNGIGGVIIGAQTNPCIEVTPEMVQPIGQAAFEAGNIPMFCKNSMPVWARRRELPWKINKSVELTG